MLLQKQKMINWMRGLAALTADGGRLLEDLGDLRIHLDHQVLLHGDLLMPQLYLPADPLVEVLADDGRGDVADPLLGRLGQLELWLRIVIEDLSVIGLEEGEHFLDTEALVSVRAGKDKRLGTAWRGQEPEQAPVAEGTY